MVSASTILFLDKVSRLTLRIPGEKEQTFTRTSSELAGSPEGAQVTIPDSEKCSCEYPREGILEKLDVLRPYVGRSAHINNAVEILERILRSKTPKNL